MRSTNRHQLLGIVAATSLIGLAACSRDSSSTQSLPKISVMGSRLLMFSSLDELAAKANAIAIVKPTGKQDFVPLPQKQGGSPDSAPTPFLEMKVVRVLSGAVDGDVIRVVSPGIDENTGRQALLTGGPYLVFLAPAMYDANAPAGGYAIVGGPAGVFANSGATNRFRRVDAESKSLPSEISLDTTSLPKVRKTEAQLLTEGP